jgi:hypothetical protein
MGLLDDCSIEEMGLIQNYDKSPAGLRPSASTDPLLLPGPENWPIYV